jgi:hypothetical protein
MDFRYLVETKNEFNNFLCGILVPHLYHGIKGMLKYSDNVYNQIELKNKKGAKINNPGLILIFKKTLDGISNLNNHEIEEEYLRIKNSSGCVEWFDNMVRASFKSYVLFLTWDPKISNSKYSDNSIYDSIVIKDFIHKCYVISCNYFRDNPELFISKNSKKEIFEILKMCIEMSIKKSLPYNQIINEYLNIEFDKINDINSKEIQNIKSMVFNMMNQQKYGRRPDINNLIIEDTGEDDFVNLEDPEFKKTQLENFINNEKIKEQNYNNLSDNNLSDNDLSDNNTSESSRKINKSYKSFSKNSNRKAIESSTSENLDNSEQNSKKSNTNTNESNTLLSRADMKNKEIQNLINMNETNKVSTSETNETNETNKISTNGTNGTNNINDTNDINGTNDTNDTNKTSIIEILTSPPAIRQKKEDRINDVFELSKKVSNKQNNNIKIIRSNNIISEKFDQVESFYDNMIKI